MGGKGTGKSTAIELLRYAFDDVAAFDEMKRDTLGKALALVGVGGVVSVRCVDELGQEYVIERQVSELHDEQAVCRDSAGEIAGIPFRPVFFSQGEIVRVASSQVAQMNLVDAYVDVTQPSRDEAAAVERLEKNAVELLQTEERLAKLRSEVNDPKVGKKVTAAEVKKLERALKEPILKEFPKWEGEKRFVESRLVGIGQVPQVYQDAIDNVDVEALFDVDLAEDAPNAKALASLETLPDDVRKLLKSCAGDLRRGVQALKAEAEKRAKEWQAQYAQQRKQYEQVVAKSREKSVSALQAKLGKSKRHLETLVKSENDIGRLQVKLANLQAARGKALDALRAARRTRFETRLQIAKRWGVSCAGFGGQ